MNFGKRIKRAKRVVKELNDLSVSIQNLIQRWIGISFLTTVLLFSTLPVLIIIYIVLK